VKSMRDLFIYIWIESKIESKKERKINPLIK